MINPKRHKAWYRRSVLYEIYPASFADSNGDGVGDLRGIINHLDYLNDGTPQSLGVGAIWLAPIYQSGGVDGGYDVVDYRSIDSRFGTMADFDELVKVVHSRGMKLLMDFVPNHTSDKHPWFRESRLGRDNAKRDWYIWADAKSDGGLPNNWLSHMGGPAWTLDESTGQYYLHLFTSAQPDLNWRNPEVRNAMMENLRFWLRRGIDGYRVDAVGALLKDAALRDDPPNPRYRAGVSRPADANERLYSNLSEVTDEVMEPFCQIIAEHTDDYLLSEAYLNVPGLHALYGACRQHNIHAPFNFNLMSLSWGAAEFRSFIDEYEASLGPDDWPNYVLGNHDHPRLISRVGPERARLLAFLQMTLRGLPVVYYGDEIGIKNGVKNTTEIRDVARTPMPWTGEIGAGFTTGQPWLPLAPGSVESNVADESRQPDSMLHLYQYLVHLRKTSSALADGTYRSLDLQNPAVFGFARETGLSQCYVLLNFTGAVQEVRLGTIGRWIAGTARIEGDGQEHPGGSIRLSPYEGRLYERNRRRA